MARVRTKKVVFTFATTTQAMKMEQCMKEEGAPGRLIPVPTQISAGCGMAWCAPVEEKERLVNLTGDRKIEVEGLYELLL